MSFSVTTFLTLTVVLFLVDCVSAEAPNQTALIVGTVLGILLIGCIVGAFVYLWVSCSILLIHS